MFPIPLSKIESIMGHVIGISSPLSWGGEGVGEIKQITNGWNVLPVKVFPFLPFHSINDCIRAKS